MHYKHLLLLGTLCLSACTRSESAIGTPATPLVMMLSPVSAERSSAEERQALAAFLTRETSLAVEVRVASDAVTAIEAFSGAGGADLGLLNLFEYLLAHEEYGVNAGLQTVREGAADYVGEILVKQGSDLSALKDLAGKKIAYVDPYSSSGFVFPAQLLAKESVAVTAVFSGSPEKALAQLAAGQVDAAAVYRGANQDASLRVLATTAPIPNEPIFFRAQLSAEKRALLQRALLKFADSAEGARILGKLAGITALKPITDEGYREVSLLLRASGKSVSEMVHRGWEVNQPSVDLIP